MTTWWLMHGYAAYIWPSYGLVFGVLIANALQAYRRARQVRQLLQQWLAEQ